MHRTRRNYFEIPSHLYQKQLYRQHKAAQAVSNTMLYHHIGTQS